MFPNYDPATMALIYDDMIASSTLAAPCNAPDGGSSTGATGKAGRLELERHRHFAHALTCAMPRRSV